MTTTELPSTNEESIDADAREPQRSGEPEMRVLREDELDALVGGAFPFIQQA